MSGKKDGQLDSFHQEGLFESLVEKLFHQITTSCHENPDPEMACVVYVATTDQKALEYGWPSAKIMQEGVRQAMEILPSAVAERVELEEI